MQGRSYDRSPHRRDETWRYSDLDAVARVWPVATHAHIVPPGETFVRDIILAASDDSVTIEDHDIAIGAGARAEFRVVVAGGRLGRVFLKVRLAEGAQFALTGAIVGGDASTNEIVTRVTHAEPNATSTQTVRAILAAARPAPISARSRSRAARRGPTAASRSRRCCSIAPPPPISSRARNLRRRRQMRAWRDGGRARCGALFYLASRGLPPAEAKTLLLRAFVGGCSMATNA